MQLEAVKSWYGLESLYPELKDEIWRIVTWKTRPQFVETGRTAWHATSRKFPVALASGSYNICALKVKGVGLGIGDTVQRPSTKAFLRSQPHLGFDSQGTFISVESAASPLGGISFSRAETEFDVASGFLAAGGASIFSLSLFRQDSIEYSFNGEPMGIVVTGLDSELPVRADRILDFPGENQLWNAEISSWAASFGLATELDFRVPLLVKLSEQYGRELRKFHEAGYYRYSGGLSNYAYSVQRGSAYLVDFDSCQYMSSCAPSLRSLEVLRDVMSMIYHLSGRLLREENIEYFSPARMTKCTSAFYAVIRSYFHDVPESLVEIAAREFEGFYRDAHSAAMAFHTNSVPVTPIDPNVDYQAHRHATAKKRWFNAEAMQVKLMLLLGAVYEGSDLQERFGTARSPEELAALASPYLTSSSHPTLA